MIGQLKNWFKQKGWEPYTFQTESWQAYFDGKSGLVNAPTGSGKTFALALPILLDSIGNKQHLPGLKALWITPIRALTNDLKKAIAEAAKELEINCEIGARTGDTSVKERAKQKKKMPDLLITTPESMHILLAQKNASEIFANLQSVVVDEWHELLGSKRGVQTELALCRLRGLNPQLKTWGISATIGNLEEAMEVLLGNSFDMDNICLIRATHKKDIEVISILPDDVDELPWAGHLGIKLINKIIPLLFKAKTTLIFTNTRSQTEIWYRTLLEVAPELAGSIAVHHGSLSNTLREWVEENLHAGLLRVVVCTSSLDLGVDFRPVEQIIQIGGPKGVARFLQRAGRSGHQPGAASRIYFVPTHALELMEADALRTAIDLEVMESRQPIIRAFDVLCQFLLTLSVGEGFSSPKMFNEVKSTYCYNSINEEEWQWVLYFITKGGDSLGAYDEFNKVEIIDGVYKMLNKKALMRHRLSIGTIVSDPVLSVKLLKGGYLGTVEEYFISRLKPGDVFWFAGKNLELIQLKDLTVLVRKSTQKSGKVPAWMGGRMPLSSELSSMLRQRLYAYQTSPAGSLGKEFDMLAPLLLQQQRLSALPRENELLIEKLDGNDGHHIFVYPFEGRLVHEGIAGLLAYRISKEMSISFSIAMNDYGFELLSDQPIPIEEAIGYNVFGEENLANDLLNSLNAAEMARRKFRDIASIAGLVFQGYPGKNIKSKHLQASSALFFEVFKDNEPNNLLLKQAYEEVLYLQLEEVRLRNALRRINASKIIITQIKSPSPFSFPILVDSLREKVTSETLEDRIKKMQLSYTKLK